YAIGQSVPLTFELIGSRIHPDDLPAFKERVEWARRGATDLEFEHRLQLPDHSVKYVHVVAKGMRTDDGQLEYIGAVQDVTERRLSGDALGRLGSELAHLARVTTLGEMTASIAHEVKQPITAAVTSAQTALRWLDAEPPDLDEVREALSRIVRAGKQAGDVVGRIRALVTKTPFRKDSLDLNAALREIVQL